MDKSVNGKLKILRYNGKKGEYFITYINGKTHFVIIKDKNNGEFVERVNIKTEKPYILFNGQYKIINDLVFI